MLAVIDIPFALLTLFLALKTGAKGFMQELFSKLAIVAGAVAAFFFYRVLEVRMAGVLGNRFLSLVASFILIFALTYLVIRIIGQLVVGAIGEGEILKGLDRVLGFFLGALEGLTICAVVIFLLKSQSWFNLSAAYSNSIVYKIVAPFLVIAEGKIV